MKAYECVECGKVIFAKDYLRCPKHKAMGMVQVVGWGKNGEPEGLKKLYEQMVAKKQELGALQKSSVNRGSESVVK